MAINDTWIGQTVRRTSTTGTYTTKIHRVESVIAGAAVTHCGRFLMEHTDDDAQLSIVSAGATDDFCKRCA